MVAHIDPNIKMYKNVTFILRTNKKCLHTLYFECSFCTL